jgi:hypothetical protein
MSLDWDLTACKNKETFWQPVPGDYHPGMFDTTREQEDGTIERLAPFVTAAIFRCMVLGFGQITTKNVDEIIIRSRMYDRISGPALYGPNGTGPNHDEHNLTPNHWHSLIGLVTNASTLSKAAFGKNLTRIMREQAERHPPPPYDEDTAQGAAVSEAMDRRDASLQRHAL